MHTRILFRILTHHQPSITNIQSAMEKEGNLHLARPWNRHRSRPPSAPAVGRPTERKKVPPRPPINLTPHMQRPYYL